MPIYEVLKVIMSKLIKFFLLSIILIALFFAYKQINLYLHPSLVSDEFAFGNGRIEATEISIMPKIAGRVVATYVEEGAIVQEGEKLIQLDTKELDAQLEYINAQIQQAKENKNYALAMFEQKEHEYTLAQKNFKRAQTLYKKKAIAELQYEEDELRYYSTLASKKAAKASVAQADEAIHVLQAQAKTIQVKIDDSTLYAPKQARVLYKLVQEGEVVGSGQSVLILLDLLDTYMTIFLPTSQAGLVHYGTQSRIVLDAFSDIAIPAKVTYISPKAQFTPKQIETQEEREKLMFRIKANIDLSLLKEHIDKIKTGLPGVMYIPLTKSATWPKALDNLPDSYQSNMK